MENLAAQVREEVEGGGGERKWRLVVVLAEIGEVEYSEVVAIAINSIQSYLRERERMCDASMLLTTALVVRK